MALQTNKVHIGMGRIFLDVTAPATGVSPTPGPTPTPIDSDGAPTSGTEVGYTNGPSTFTYKQTKQEVDAEQSLNPIAVFTTNEEVMLEFNAMEHTYNTLKVAFDNVGSLSNSTRDFFWAGDSVGLADVLTRCVVLTSRVRGASSKFEVVTIYKAYNVEGVVIPYGKTSVAMYKVTLKGLVDPNRAVGDRLCQWYREVTATGVSASASVSPSASKSPSASASPS
jgi:hypothetical protein